MKITTENNTEKEQEVKKIVSQVIEKYNVPKETDHIHIEEGGTPHSHPVLTLGTHYTDPLILLRGVVHEQLHWHAQNHSNYDEAISFLKDLYEDDGEHNRSGTYPNSYWEHLIVIFNTRKVLEELLTKEEVEEVYSGWLTYPTAEAFIVSENISIEAHLKKFDLIYTRK